MGVVGAWQHLPVFSQILMLSLHFPGMTQNISFDSNSFSGRDGVVSVSRVFHLLKLVQAGIQLSAISTLPPGTMVVLSPIHLRLLLMSSFIHSASDGAQCVSLTARCAPDPASTGLYLINEHAQSVPSTTLPDICSSSLVNYPPMFYSKQHAQDGIFLLYTDHKGFFSEQIILCR